MPVIAQLRVDFRMRRIMKRGRIIGSVLVPTSDLVRNGGGFFQRDSVQKRGDLRARGRMRQLLVGDRADDFMADRAVTIRVLKNKKREKCDCDFEVRSHASL